MIHQKRKAWTAGTPLTPLLGYNVILSSELIEPNGMYVNPDSEKVGLSLASPATPPGVLTSCRSLDMLSLRWSPAITYRLGTSESWRNCNHTQGEADMRGRYSITAKGTGYRRRGQRQSRCSET